MCSNSTSSFSAPDTTWCFYILNPTCGYDPSILLLRSLRALLRLVTLFTSHCDIFTGCPYAWNVFLICISFSSRQNDKHLSRGSFNIWWLEILEKFVAVWTTCRGALNLETYLPGPKRQNNITVIITISMTHARSMYLHSCTRRCRGKRTSRTVLSIYKCTTGRIRTKARRESDRPRMHNRHISPGDSN